MNYGYNMAAAGVITAMMRQDVAANNLANIETVGFKPDAAFTIPRQAARIEDRLHDLPSNKLLERLGAGVLMAPVRTVHRQGALMPTGNPLDLAIRGEGFFMVEGASAGAGAGSGQQVRLTRDGRLTLNERGELVTVSGGHRVLDDAGRAISLGRGGRAEIDGDGTIRQDGAEIARVRLAVVPNKQQLRKVGENLYVANSTALSSRTDAGGEIVQGHVERSAVDPISAMMAVTNAAGAVAAATRVMSVHDELVGRMVGTLGRVSG